MNFIVNLIIPAAAYSCRMSEFFAIGFIIRQKQYHYQRQNGKSMNFRLFLMQNALHDMDFTSYKKIKKHLDLSVLSKPINRGIDWHDRKNL